MNTPEKLSELTTDLRELAGQARDGQLEAGELDFVDAVEQAADAIDGLKARLDEVTSGGSLFSEQYVRTQAARLQASEARAETAEAALKVAIGGLKSISSATEMPPRDFHAARGLCELAHIKAEAALSALQLPPEGDANA